jgi:gamma-glutamyltranspeptidase/glutathione hydrolase
MKSSRPILALASAVAICYAFTAAAGTALETTATGAHGAVATDQRLASKAGLRILREGGNAVDAAVAIGYTLAVTYPAAGNLGGGGFMLVRFANGRSHFIDFRETAPAAATANMYLDAAGNVVPELSTVGPLSAGVPGTVAGLEYARATYGTLSRHELMRDALAYAEGGFILSEADAAEIARARSDLSAFPATAAIFVPGGKTPPAGVRFRQPDLASTLHHIDRDGAAGFYRGSVARELTAAARASGGIMTEVDLARYRAIDRKPLMCSYRRTLVITAPLPSSGGVTMCETLGILSADVPALPVRDFENAHLEIEAERRAFVDRNMQLGDPAFVPSKVARLLDPAYLARLRTSILPERATASTTLRSGIDLHEGTNTTNYSVVDAAGNAVDVTYTINNWFGSDFVAGRTGVLLNDEMDDFTSKPGVPNMMRLVQGTANKIEPGKRPLSSMTPTIVAGAAGRIEFVTGAAGGPRIITTVLDSVRAVVDFHQDAGTALAAPRMHMQWLPDVIYAEPRTFDEATLGRLRADGYTVDVRRPIGTVANAIGIGSDGLRTASHDPRNRTGAAVAF